MPTKQEERDKQISELHRKQEEQLVQQTAQKIGVTYVDLTGIGIDTDALRVIDEEDARNLEIACFKKVGDDVHVAARSPLREATQNKVKELEDQDYNVTLYMASSTSLNKAWERYADITSAYETEGGMLDISEASLKNITNSINSNEDVKEMFNQTLESDDTHKVSKLMEILFGSGIATKSSDIHVEPQEEDVRIRFRQDGVLHDILSMDHENFKHLKSRIKLLSGVKITQNDEAQDGRFTIEYNNMDIEIRTSIIPGGYGEGIVMRILNPEGINVGLEKLGIPKALLDTLKKEIAKPNGLILTTGPTGSGKTTTLYSFLKYVYSPEIKILTIEDPIEYHLDGITQTQVDHSKGYDFNAGLRAAMRQDPDVALVGEIRDKETAGIAVNASLTGHLVFSTLHTNNAAGAIPRLLDLSVKPGILSTALSASIAQRLVRKLCENCKKKTKPNTEQAKVMHKVIDNARKLGKDLSEYNADIESDEEIEVWQAQGCDTCENTGYKGRLGVFEAILSDSHLQEILEKTPSERNVKIVSAAQGILTMKEDGVSKILAGVTSMEEVQKVVDLEEDLDLFPEMKEYVDQHKKPTEETENTAEDTSKANETEEDQSEHTEQKEEEPPTTNNNETRETETLESEYTEENTEEPNTKPRQSEQEKNNTQTVQHLRDDSDSLPSTEIQLLIDYLKHLENETPENSKEDWKQKIQQIEHTIVELLKQHPEATQYESEKNRTKNELDLIMDEIKNLKNNTGSYKQGTADQLQTLRSSLEAMQQNE